MNILFTILALDGYHGSVMHVKEWAEFFLTKYRSNIDTVSVVTGFATEEIRNMFVSLGIDVYTINDELLLEEYDIVFAYHFPIIETLLAKGLKCKKLVLGSLSSFEGMEFLTLFWDSASLIVVVSEEVKQKFKSSFGIPESRMIVLENAIPDLYANYVNEREIPLDRPKRIIIVSNHIPQELLDLKKLLEPYIKVDCFGMGTENYQEINPRILSEYDLVITIGKTVQFTMGLGIPVFEYDYFGGIGYINLDNLDNEAKTNFSGRSTRRKLDANGLKNEILEGYHGNRLQIDKLRRTAIEKFLLSTRLEKLVKLIDESKDFSLDCNSVLNKDLYLAHGVTTANWIVHLKNELNAYKSNTAKLEVKLESITDENKKLKEHIHMIQSTNENNIAKLEVKLESITDENKKLKEHVHMIQSTKGYKVLELLRRVRNTILNKRDM